MKLTFENVIAIAALLLFEAWFLKGYFAGNPEFEPGIGLILAIGAVFAKDPIKAKFGIGSTARKHDHALFEEFMSVFPTEPTVRFFREHDFGGSFHRECVAPLTNLVATWDTVEKEFMDKKLESKKKLLYAAAKELALEIARRTVPVGTGDFASVYSDNQRNSGNPRPASVIEDAKVLNDISTAFVPKYEEFIRVCRAKLVE